MAGIASTKAHNIYMMGDSHVGSKLYPNKVEQMIRTKYPDIKFTYSYKNGLRFSHFNSNPEFYNKIASSNTDILILNLGTNEAYTNRFSSSNFKKHLEAFYSGLIKKMPDIKVVFVTPYTNVLKLKGTAQVNENNRLAADLLKEFVTTHPNTYVVDINEEVGSTFIDTPKLNRDKVHLSAEGYKMLGTMVGEDILKIPNLLNN